MIWLVLTDRMGRPKTVAGHHIIEIGPVHEALHLHREPHNARCWIAFVGHGSDDCIFVRETYAEVNQMLFDLSNAIERTQHVPE